uniref:Uncharacterized protein n=1 Tax=Equus asinus TaxID=9793 RepID=A0A9L0I695_EQUAS
INGLHFSEMIFKIFILVECFSLFFRVGEVSACLEKYIFPQSCIRKLALVREVSFRMIQKTKY